MTYRPAEHRAALPIALREGTRSDLPALTTLLCDAFMEDELSEHTLPQRRKYPLEYRQHNLHELRMCFVLPVAKFVLAVYAPPPRFSSRPPAAQRLAADSAQQDGEQDEQPAPQPGEILGFAVFAAMGPSQLADTWNKAGSTWSTALETGLLLLGELYAKYVTNHVADHGVIARLEAAHVGDLDLPRNDLAAQDADAAGEGQGLLRLMVLATAPNWQGRGVGKALMRWGMRTARAEGLPLTLAASLTGREFYEKLGFKTFRFDVVEGHGDALHLPNLLWEPDQYRGRWLEEDGNGGWKIKGK